MPLPERRKGEPHESFVVRCLADAEMVRDYPDLEKRRAACERQWFTTEASGGADLLTAAAASEGVSIEAAAGEPTGPRKITLRAYNGGPMRIIGFPAPVLVDLVGLRSRGKRPILHEHSAYRPVGHTTDVQISATRVVAIGLASGAGQVVRDILAAADNKFPWKASIGVDIEQLVFLDKGEKLDVNGRSVTGPAYVIRRGLLREISVVALAADDTTSARLAASAGIVQTLLSETRIMDEFEKWLTANGHDPQALDAEERDELKAKWEAQKTPPSEPAPQPEAPTPPAKAEAPLEASAAQPDLQARREAVAAEVERIDAVHKLCAGSHADIEAKAIREAWSPEKVELELLRADRPGAPAIHATANVSGRPEVLEAAACQSLHLGGIEKAYPDETLQAAWTTYRGEMGLQELLLNAAWANGYVGARARITDSNLPDVLRAAFSTVDISGILSNIANKSLEASFNAVEQTWKAICRVRPVKDFKTVTRYRLTTDMAYQRVGPDGELKHAKIGEASYTNKADTYGILFSLTREFIINDDLGALQDVPSQLGRGGALSINNVFWPIFMGNSGFFKTANKNYQAGADTALGIDGLAIAEALFYNQTDAAKNPMAITPKILLTPNALSADARQLMASLRLTEGGGSSKSKVPTENIYAGAFRAERSAYLSNSNITGNSVKAWYLLADPEDMAVIEVVFLNGKVAPTVQQAEANFNVLGVQFRGFHDFGVSLREPRGGVKMKGEV